MASYTIEFEYSANGDSCDFVTVVEADNILAAEKTAVDQINAFLQENGFCRVWKHFRTLRNGKVGHVS
jgi:hypothetical protein